MGGWEWAILVLIALLLLGGSRLSGIGRTVGNAVGELTGEISTAKSGSTDSDSESAESESEPAPESTASDDIVDAELLDAAPERDGEPDSVPESVSETETTGTGDRPDKD